MNEALKNKTITDFGSQWTAYTDNEGYYGSCEMFKDICGPLLPIADIKNAKVVDIGSGTGRIVNMILDAGAANVVAVEPSKAMDVLKDNTITHSDKIDYQQVSGELFEAKDQDYVFSIGVLHHIPDPAPVVERALDSLKPGGKMLIWLYGKENNGLYLFIFNILHAITTRLPDKVLAGFCHVLNFILGGYIVLCKKIPLPMHNYMTGVLAKLTKDVRFLVIFDQLNPAYAKYYTKEEAIALLETAGFKNVKVHHRHEYSWTICGEKPS